MKFRLILAALALPLAMPGSAATAPKVRATSINQLQQPLPYPYDEKADATAQVAAARAQARKEGKKLLVDLGGNWCADCRVLAGVMELPEVKSFLRKHYVIVTVDIGRFDRNGQVVRSYGITNLKGVPALLVVDPKSNKLLNEGRLSALADARNMTPQALADWLAQWV